MAKCWFLTLQSPEWGAVVANTPKQPLTGQRINRVSHGPECSIHALFVIGSVLDLMGINHRGVWYRV